MILFDSQAKGFLFMEGGPLERSTAELPEDVFTMHTLGSCPIPQGLFTIQISKSPSLNGQRQLFIGFILCS